MGFLTISYRPFLLCMKGGKIDREMTYRGVASLVGAVPNRDAGCSGVVLAFLLNPVQCVSQELCGILQVQLFLYPLPVGADGLHAQVELIADLADAQAFSDELENLDLPVRE